MDKRNRRETIRVENLTTGYRSGRGEKRVTTGINASLYSGELTALLGPNGAGKSTLLKSLTGFIPTLGGEILMDGKPLGGFSDLELASLIGVVLTDRISIPNMTVRTLVETGRSPFTGFWGRLDKDDHKAVEEAISLVGIENLCERMIDTLSDGERQKAMIAKSLAQATPVIFLDEPTAFLDYPSKVEIMQLLRRLSREQGKTVFLSTHDLELALQISDRIWLLSKQFGVTVGIPEDLSLSGEMERYFHHEGVDFDLTTGLFRINHTTDERVGLSGESPYVNMVEKALAREGIGVDYVPEEKAEIKADNTGFYIKGSLYPTVESLVEAVRTQEPALLLQEIPLASE